MYDSLKKDVTTTISQLEILHEMIHTRYERAQADYETLHEQYMSAIHELEQAKKDYVLIERAIKAMNELRNEDEDEGEDDYDFNDALDESWD